MTNKNSNTNRLWSKRTTSLWPIREKQNGRCTPLPRMMFPIRRYPKFVKSCATTMRLIRLLQSLRWEQIPEPPSRAWFGRTPIPLAAYIGAFLVKLEEGLPSLGHLRRYLVEHPALIWALGFSLYGKSQGDGYRFDPKASLPTSRHLSRVLREMDNATLQCLFDGQITHLQCCLPNTFGQTISLDTKHILAWVKENNPRIYIKEGRFDTTKQPAGDKDCKVGCKRRHNRVDTPLKEGKAAQGSSISVGEFYWGYASGIVVCKLPDLGEFVLAEMTQPFDKGDTTYFFPLMAQTEQRLGFRPRYGAFDAAFDAFYVYDYFDSEAHAGFAAVPFSELNETY